MTASVHPVGWLDFLRRHERRLALLWLVGTLVLFGGLAITPLRLRVLWAMQVAANRWDDRWRLRLRDGERMVAAGRYAEATPYLERLDREFPARNVRHGRDKERELLLRLLAQSYEAMGRNGHAMATWRRLVAFDSLNYSNHFGYAQAAERLLSGWALAPEARDGYARVLQILPSHLPSVRGYIDYYMDRGEFIPVVQAYSAYLDAFLVQPLTLTMGDTIIDVLVPVDGRPHEVEVSLHRSDGWEGSLGFQAQGFAFAVERVTLVPAEMVGQMRRLDPIELSLDGAIGTNLRRAGLAWVPEDSSGTLTLPVGPVSGGVRRILLRVRLYKPMDAGLWAQVDKSYRNLLNPSGLAEARDRTALFASAEDADAVLARLPWARQGVRASGDE
jgi:tetratricopeptide (TPR) repeat protein